LGREFHAPNTEKKEKAPEGKDKTKKKKRKKNRKEKKNRVEVRSEPARAWIVN